MNVAWLMKPSIWLCGKCWFVVQEEKPADKENEAKKVDKPQGKSSFVWEAEVAHLEPKLLYVPFCFASCQMDFLYEDCVLAVHSVCLVFESIHLRKNSS